MADEFLKGLAIATTAGFGWMVLSGWYTTPGFEDTQLVGEVPSSVDIYGELALISREALFWFMVLGALTFWVVIPGLNQVRSTVGDEDES
jgi:hypothetical protein